MERATARILTLAARGLTTAEIAARLDVDVSTIRERLREAQAALGARSKLETVVLALRRGLIRS